MAESVEIEHIGRRLRTAMTDVNIGSISGDWRGPSFVHSKAGRWPTQPENINSAYFIKGAWNEACLFNVGCSFPLGRRNGAASFSVFEKSDTNLPKSSLSRVITIDKSWIYHYDWKMKCESEAWLHSGKSRMKKSRQQKSVGKVMFVAFFDCRGMVYQNVCSPKTLRMSNVSIIVDNEFLTDYW